MDQPLSDTDSDSDSDLSSTSSDEIKPPRMKSAVPVFGTTRTVYDMPMRGSRDAPKTFRGHHSEVEYFINHYDKLLVKFHVTDPEDQCESILSYCSTDVQGFIRASEHYERHNWLKLRKEILRWYDADRATTRYKPSDITTYTLKTQKRPFHSLSKWKKYFIKYKTMAGILLRQGHLTRANYDIYFWLGLHPDLRQIFEQRILQLNPMRKASRQFSVREISEAAEWYFRRNRAEAMVVNAADYGIDLDSGSSEDESDKDESEDSDDSDYEIYKKKHRQKVRERKEKEKKKKQKSLTPGASTKRTLTTSGTAEEVTGLIRQLNKMSITDPEYPPVYYKVLALDTTGVAAKCVQPPRINTSWGDQSQRNPSRTKPNPPSANTTTTSSNSNSSPATYPNNIPVSSSSTTRPDNNGCYGCGTEGHRIGDCPAVKELITKEVIKVDEGTRKLRMKDGSFIRRNQGESLIQAANRLAAPRVMFMTKHSSYAQDTTDSESEEYDTRDSYRQSSVTIPDWELDTDSDVPEYSDEPQALDAHWYVAASDSEDSESEGRDIYLTVPQMHELEPIEDAQVNAAERTVPSTRTARKEAFDGVNVPPKDRNRGGPAPSPAKTAEPKAQSRRQGNDAPAQTVRDLLPPLTPVDVRTPRKVDVDMEVDSPEVHQEKQRRKSPDVRQSKSPPEAARTKDNQNDSPNSKPGGRQSDIQNTVSMSSIVERMLDLPFTMTIREAVVASKDVRTGFMDVIRLKNVKAILLGRSQDNPIVANWTWPRSEGVLIKIDVKTGNNIISAIVDTGSQLDVVRADVAALKIHRPVDMTRATSMNDANGGKGQLQGFIDDVEFNCGGVLTRADLWVSQQAPFELLLGRPWQRGNLVTIDERDEGTYLVFKDRETRLPRYKLLAIPYELCGEPVPKLFSYILDKPTTGSSTPKSVSTPMCTDLFPESIANSIQKVTPEPAKDIRQQIENWLDTMQPEGSQVAQNIGALAPKIQRAKQQEGPNSTESKPEVKKKIALESAGDQLRNRDLLQARKLSAALIPGADPTSSTNAAADVSLPEDPDLESPKGTVLDLEQRIPSNTYRADNFAPRVTDVLDRRRIHVPGPEDFQPRQPTGLMRVRATAQSQWDRHQRGEDLHIRPISIVSPQGFFTHGEHRVDGQETYHALLLNARMMIHNPLTGTPAYRNGHAEVHLYPVPANGRPWNMEVPFAPEHPLANEMGNYDPHLRREASSRPHNANGVSRAGGSRAITWRDIPALRGDTSLTTDDWVVPRSSTPADSQTEGGNPPPRYQDVPAPPGTASPSTWGWRLPLSFPLHDLLDPRYDDLASSGEPWSPPSPIPVHAPSPDLPRVTPNAILPPPTTASPPALDVAPAYRYYVFPEDEAPTRDVDAMEEMGREARTGDHVYRADTRQLGIALAPIPEEDMEMSSDGETSSSDDGFEHIGVMEDVQDDAPALRTLARVAALIDSTPNSVLERLNYNARQNLIERDESIQEPTFVFGAFHSPTPAPIVPTPPSTIAQDFDDEELQSTSSEEEGEIRDAPPVSQAAAVAIPALGNGKRGPLVTRDHYSSSPSMATVTSTAGFTEEGEEDEGRTPLLRTVHDAHEVEEDAESEMTPLRRKAQENQDEEPDRAEAEEETDDGSMPSLTDVSSESDARSDAPKYSSHQLARSLGRTIEALHRCPPTPVSDDNALAREYGLVHLWSANYDREQEAARDHDNNSVAGPLWEILDILENGHLRNAVDRVLMETDGMIDEPTWNSVTRPASCDMQRLVRRAQVNEEMLDIVSFRTHDGQRQMRSSFKFPMKASAREVRRFNANALAQDTLFRAALGSEAGKHAAEVVELTLIRQKFQTAITNGTGVAKRLGWSIDLSSLHDELPDMFDLPFAMPHENSQFRVLYHAFFTHGRSAVADAARELMKCRFKEPEFIAHLLCNGLLDPVPTATPEPDPPIITARPVTTPANFRTHKASFDFRAEFPPPNPATFQNDTTTGGSRLTQSWVDAALHNQAVHISARAVEARNALEAKLDAVRNQSVQDCLRLSARAIETRSTLDAKLDAARNQSLHDCLQHGLTPCRPTYQLPAKALAKADRKGKRKMSPRRSDLRQYTPSPLARAVYTPYASSSST
ncbi:hypothetical protein DFH06DRAFT_1336122 [Mycena polygramma]|nr:hypothetical protein DFH06DRAFT_1336122 [Mycena polygramma]